MAAHRLLSSEQVVQSALIARRPLLGAAAAAAAAGLAAVAGPASAASRTQLFQQYYELTDRIHGKHWFWINRHSTRSAGTVMRSNFSRM